MEKVAVEKSVGMVLGHDLTKIKPGDFKGAGLGFKKGHVIKPEDIPKLKKTGNDHVYAFELPQGHIHEAKAARRMAKECGRFLTFATDVKF